MTDIKTDPIFTQILNENSYSPTRKNLIKSIQSILGGKVITCIENSQHPFASIMSHDSIYFEDLLKSTSDTKNGFLILNSRGGDGNAAEKLLSMCKKRFSENFTIIVPNFAKSAATMMCLGSDKIMMGYSAELGPIDPQIITGNNQFVPARSFIDGLEMVRENVKNGDPPEMYLSMLQQIQPELIAICKSAIKNAEEFAKDWLSKGMLQNNTDHAEKVASWLSDGKTYKSHGKVIDHMEAKDKLKLNVELIDPNSELWYLIWELYVRSEHDLSKSTSVGAAKLYESELASLRMNILIPKNQ